MRFHGWGVAFCAYDLGFFRHLARTFCLPSMNTRGNVRIILRYFLEIMENKMETSILGL